jgi:hypothetical protein
VRHLGLERRPLRRKIVRGPRTLGSAIGTVFQEYARLHGKDRWGDKRPLYFAEVDVLLRLFPDAQVVHVLRDPRATVASLKRMPWWPYGSIGAMATWAQSDYCARRNGRRLPADTFHVVRYEELVADPKQVLTRLCAFLDEEFDEAMLDPHEVAEVVPEGKTWHARLRGEVDAARIGSWREELAPWEVGLIETVLRRPLRRRGYELTGLGTRPTPWLLARYAGASLQRRVAMHLRWAGERRDAARTHHPVAARLTSGQIASAGERGP